MLVKLTGGFFNRDKHLGADFQDWIDIQYPSARCACMHAETAVQADGLGGHRGGGAGL